VEKAVEKHPENARFGHLLVDKWSIHLSGFPCDANQRGPYRGFLKYSSDFSTTEVLSSWSIAGFSTGRSTVRRSDSVARIVVARIRRHSTFGRL
jgi:hypothetical protein